MVNSIGLNPTPLKPLHKNNSRVQAKPAFGAMMYEEVEEAPDRSFSIKNAGRAFCKGFTEPLQDLVKLMKEPGGLAAVAAGGLGVGLLMAKYKPLAKYALVATSALAAFNIGKGAYEFTSAENAEQKEQSFDKVGKGTFYGLTSVLPASTVARSQGIKANNPVQSLVKLWNSTLNDIKTILKKPTIKTVKEVVFGLTESTAPASLTVADVVDNATPSDFHKHKKDDQTLAQAIGEVTGDKNLANATALVEEGLTDPRATAAILAKEVKRMRSIAKAEET